MAKSPRKSGPDLLALAMRRVRDDMAAGRVPKHPPEVHVESTCGSSDSDKRPAKTVEAA